MDRYGQGKASSFIAPISFTKQKSSGAHEPGLPLPPSDSEPLSPSAESGERPGLGLCRHEARVRAASGSGLLGALHAESFAPAQALQQPLQSGSPVRPAFFLS